MAIYELGDRLPNIDADAYVHPEAVVIGDVTIGPEASIWPGAVLRGDYGDHHRRRPDVDPGRHRHPRRTRIPHDRRIGMRDRASRRTSRVARWRTSSLVGSGSVVLHHAVIGTGATVAANAVVPNRMVVPAGALALGVPAVVREGASDTAMIRFSAAEYVANSKRFRTQLRRVD